MENFFTDIKKESNIKMKYIDERLKSVSNYWYNEILYYV